MVQRASRSLARRAPGVLPRCDPAPWSCGLLWVALLEQGYSRRFAIGSITSGGTLGIIIPPSLPLIAYGLATDQSISDLFIAGIVPGLVLTVALVA